MDNKIAYVYGNGKSRKGWDISRKIEGVTTWGCNAIYRDGVVDNLVCVDSVCSRRYTNLVIH